MKRLIHVKSTEHHGHFIKSAVTRRTICKFYYMNRRHHLHGDGEPVFFSHDNAEKNAMLFTAAPEMMDLIVEFGDAVTDMFEQMTKGNWTDKHDHSVVMNIQMDNLEKCVEKAIELREPLIEINKLCPKCNSEYPDNNQCDHPCHVAAPAPKLMSDMPGFDEASLAHQERVLGEPTLEENGYTVDRDEQVTVSMGLLDDLMNLIDNSSDFKTWNSVTTADCFVALAAIVMKVDEPLDKNLYSLEFNCVVDLDSHVNDSHGDPKRIVTIDRHKNEIEVECVGSSFPNQILHPSEIKCVWRAKDLAP